MPLAFPGLLVAKQCALVLAGLVGMGGTSGAAWAQSEAPLPAAPDPQTPGAPSPSIGQPPLWKLSVGGGFVLEPGAAGETIGPRISAAVERDLSHPLLGAALLRGALAGGTRWGRPDGGAQVTVESPLLMLFAGVDWSARTHRVDPILGLRFPARRGGLFGRGDDLRVEYRTGRDARLGLTVSMPLGRPLAGKIHPRGDLSVRLPVPPTVSQPEPERTSPELADAMDATAEALERVVTASTVFLRDAPRGMRYRSGVAAWRSAMLDARAQMEEWDRTLGEQATHGVLVERYHAAFDRALGLAMGASADRAMQAGRPLADRARQIALETVVLPYNRSIGQFREPDTLRGLAAEARSRWIAWVELEWGTPSTAEQKRRAVEVLDRWFEALEGARRRIARAASDPRSQWLPMALVLRPEEHATQAQIDALVEDAVGRGFEGGNALLPINGAQFERDLLRSIGETEAYHILWLHDYRGRDDDGAMDRSGFRVSEHYMRALLQAIRRYDETGRLPVFMILLDQLFYEDNDGRLWMTLLEDPLRSTIDLPGDEPDAARRITALQDSLRGAVAQSRRLRAEEDSFGSDRVRGRVKVHVSITNPSDLSFRSTRLFAFPPGGDNMMREHRKMVIRDVFEDRPAMGEVILTGAGVGEKYAAPEWDDSGLILQGPAASIALEEVRLDLARHGIGPDVLPDPLRERPRSHAHAAAVAALEAAGASARVLQLHNRTGWDRKEASFVLMLLYDLAPAGSILYVPDSSWTGTPWMAQLVSAAMRGCHVLVVGPARTHDPSIGFPWHSVMQQLFMRAVILQEVLGPRIRAGGGDLRLGLFDRAFPLGNPGPSLAALERSLEAHGFLRELLPFRPDFWEALRPLMEDGAVELRRIEDADEGRLDGHPELHRKTHWVVSRELLGAVAASPELAELVGAAAREREELTHVPEGGRLIGQRRLELIRKALALHDEADPAIRSGAAWYSNGSMNKSVRSLALDGDVTAVVAGPWVLASIFELIFFTSGVTWIADLGALEERVPPLSFLQRQIGRWLRGVL